MSDGEIYEILKKFDMYLEIGNMISFVMRWIGWALIQGLAWLVDGLENITDSVLGIKLFFSNEGVQEFVKSIQPFLYILLGFSFLYIGYMLIMNRKIDREKIAMNIFISIAVIVLLNTGMGKANKFTDAAIGAVDVNVEGTISEKIIKAGLTDVAQFDVKNWKTTDLAEPNKIPQENIRMINITEQIDGDFEISKDNKISEKGGEILEKRVTLDASGNGSVTGLENGWFDFFEEKYYRWHWDFWTISISLFVTGMTLLFISIKLAKLSYELAFNYVLATIIAPADVANGQMLKELLKRILNTFMIIIMIFISMKIYLMATEFISDELDGMAYLVALIAISIAVVDGPVMCERLFGIDAGLKSGWQTVIGGVAAARAVKGVGDSIIGTTGKMASMTSRNGNTSNHSSKGDSNSGKPALHDEMKQKEGRTGEKKSQNGGDDLGKKHEPNGKNQMDNEKSSLDNQMKGDQSKEDADAALPVSLAEQMKTSGFDSGKENDSDDSGHDHQSTLPSLSDAMGKGKEEDLPKTLSSTQPSGQEALQGGGKEGTNQPISPVAAGIGGRPNEGSIPSTGPITDRGALQSGGKEGTNQPMSPVAGGMGGRPNEGTGPIPGRGALPSGGNQGSNQPISPVAGGMGGRPNEGTGPISDQGALQIGGNQGSNQPISPVAGGMGGRPNEGTGPMSDRGALQIGGNQGSNQPMSPVAGGMGGKSNEGTGPIPDQGALPSGMKQGSIQEIPSTSNQAGIEVQQKGTIQSHKPVASVGGSYSNDKAAREQGKSQDEVKQGFNPNSQNSYNEPKSVTPIRNTPRNTKRVYPINKNKGVNWDR
ncbi:pLS20_p028 family conjugation system transmembrane protein [Bacillus sp. 37MA]|uniref:pLS20_p028 family conjugation system transmembrane protein n=1 Tax=Bacillus sp. 37MA TaxID=1132442 RepID=UPI00035EFD6D|nr:hypothetical protein [Bacillus sp. 37MA]